VLATEGLADFERQQLRAKATLNQLRKTIDVQSGRAEPRNLEERLVRERYQQMQFFDRVLESIIIKISF